MIDITKITRFTIHSISLILLALSIIGLFGVNDNYSNEIESSSSFDAETAKESLVANRQSSFVADGDTIVIRSKGTDLSYDVTEIRAKAGSEITIRYENTSDMPHNVVFVNSRADIQPVGVAGIRARDTGYVPMDDDNQSRIFAYTELAKPSDTVFVTLTVPEPGTYPYICTYPGHFTMMQGDLISEE